MPLALPSGLPSCLPSRGLLAPVALALAVALCSAGASARCVDEDSLQAFTREAAAPVAGADPRAQMQLMVQEALHRSHSVGAAQMLASAAMQDIDEARAAKSMQASASFGVGPGGSRSNGVNDSSAAQLRASVNLSQLLLDGGRTQKLVDWREQLFESARLGNLSLQEQLALSAVSLAVERSRYRSQVQVSSQQLRKMACLVQALQGIVNADRGRASELVLARKSLEQADLAMAQTRSQLRQVEIRLRRLVGDGLPPTEGMTTLFTDMPPLETLVADVDRSLDIEQLGAQAAAASRLADANAANGKAQLSWQLSAGTALSVGRSSSNNGSGNEANGNYALGFTVNLPLLTPGLDAGVKGARLRAQAANLQRLEVLELKRFRVTEVFEQADSAMDRARRLAALLQSSDQVRNSTLEQWQQLGRRSLFDVMSSEVEHYGLRVAYVNALHDLQQLNANLVSMGRGVNEWLR